MPVLNACLILSGVQDREAKVLLTSQALQSTVWEWDYRTPINCVLVFLQQYSISLSCGNPLKDTLN